MEAPARIDTPGSYGSDQACISRCTGANAVKEEVSEEKAENMGDSGGRAPLQGASGGQAGRSERPAHIDSMYPKRPEASSGVTAAGACLSKS